MWAALMACWKEGVVWFAMSINYAHKGDLAGGPGANDIHATHSSWSLALRTATYPARLAITSSVKPCYKKRQSHLCQ